MYVLYSQVLTDVCKIWWRYEGNSGHMSRDINWKARRLCIAFCGEHLRKSMEAFSIPIHCIAGR